MMTRVSVTAVIPTTQQNGDENITNISDDNIDASTGIAVVCDDVDRLQTRVNIKDCCDFRARCAQVRHASRQGVKQIMSPRELDLPEEFKIHLKLKRRVQ